MELDITNEFNKFTNLHNKDSLDTRSAWFRAPYSSILMEFISYIVGLLIRHGSLPEEYRQWLLRKLEKAYTLDFENALLALYVTQGNGNLAHKACRTIENYDEYGLKLRSSNLDAYIVLLIQFLKEGIFNILHKTNYKCIHALVNVLKRSLEEFHGVYDKVDIAIANTVLDFAEVLLYDKNRSKALEEASRHCLSLQSPEREFCMLACISLAWDLDIVYNYGIFVDPKVSNRIKEYINEIRRDEIKTFTLTLGEESTIEYLPLHNSIKVYVVERGSTILNEIAVKFNELINQIKGAFRFVIWICIALLYMYLSFLSLNLLPYLLNMVLQGLNSQMKSVTGMIAGAIPFLLCADFLTSLFKVLFPEFRRIPCILCKRFYDLLDKHVDKISQWLACKVVKRRYKH